MQATASSGFMYLNAANLWPTFVLDSVAIDIDGALTLTTAGSGYSTAGVVLGGPFQALDGNTPWYRFTLDGDLPDATHVQVFTFTSDSGTTPPFAPSSSVPFPGWQAAPRDTLQGVIFNAPAPNLWIGIVLRGDGSGTPVVRQIRIDYGRDTYLKYLPSMYRADSSSADLLDRLLSLAETALGDLRGEIIGLTRLFDPAAAGYLGYPSWFAWLSGWLAWQLDQNWTEGEAREFLAEAFRLYSMRGTVDGLRRYLKIYGGVNAFISEPALNTTVWSLGANSTLGFTTMLAPGSAAGSILDSTAILDAANLTGPADAFGSDLFDDVANRFCVEINAGELTRPGALAAVRAVLEREKPAHTVYELCIVPARMRVGAQSRIGIDTVIGGPREMQLGSRLDNAVLAANDRECLPVEVTHVH